MEDLKTFNRIVELLKEKGYEYQVIEHEHVHTSEDAAKVRGTKLEEAAKALVLEAGSGKFFMCVAPGHTKLDLKRIKGVVNEKNVRLANPNDVLRETGCKVGTVPPFSSLLGLNGYADTELFLNDHVVFSAGSHYKSIRMKAKEWLDVSGCKVERLSRVAFEE